MILHRNKPEEKDSGLPKVWEQDLVLPRTLTDTCRVLTIKTRKLQVGHRGSLDLPAPQSLNSGLVTATALTVTENLNHLECGATGQHLKQITAHLYPGALHGNYKTQKLIEIRCIWFCLDFKLKSPRQYVGHNVIFKYNDIRLDLLCRKPLMWWQQALFFFLIFLCV